MPQPTVPSAPLLADHPFVRQLHATTPLEAGQMAGHVAQAAVGQGQSKALGRLSFTKHVPSG